MPRARADPAPRRRGRAILVASTDAEVARRALLGSGSLRFDAAVERDGAGVWLPVQGRLPELPVPYRAAMRRLAPKETRGDPREGLLRSLGEQTAGLRLRAFDTVGDVAVIDLPAEIDPESAARVGQAILRVNRHLRAVFAREGARRGAYRTWRLRWLAGRRSSRTVHREGGARYQVDPRTSYFSPRLGSERHRIAGLVQPGERVLVLFAGVGPFAVAIARAQREAEVAAVELNPAAVRDLEANVVLNHLQGRVTVWEGDARRASRERFQGWADRIVMPLPHEALEYLPDALAALSAQGGSVHVYALAAGRGRAVDGQARLDEAQAMVVSVGRRLRGSGWRLVRPYAPDLAQVVLELEVAGLSDAAGSAGRS